ncbi:uncharacterized protein [Hetaerina americana]|uniref:uncharacterized protein n=1 Tax=Hetaerina americana TaxID=62018 RepID=UPI003A7F4D7B
MDDANPGDKENTLTHLRNKIESWREERYEKLCSRLLKVREGNENQEHFVSPSILGMKCPKKLSERVTHPECEIHGQRKIFGHLQPNGRPRKSGMRHRVPKKFSEGPAVRQTITSKLRVLQNNPFMNIHIGNNCEAVGLNGTTIAKSLDVSDTESPEPIFSTPAVGNNHPQFPESISVIKHVKSPTHVIHSKTVLKYD